MNDRHRRVAKLKKQELNKAKAKFEREYGVSTEQAIELVDVFVKTIAETAGIILILLVSTVSQQVELKHLKQENQLMKNMLQKTEFSFFGELDKYK